MANLATTRNSSTSPTIRSGGVPVVVDRQTGRALGQLERRTIVRIASVQADSMVQVEKLHEVDRLTREASTGYAMLRKWNETLAAGDLFLAEELKFFTDIARVGKGQIIADTVSDFCQESRR